MAGQHGLIDTTAKVEGGAALFGAVLRGYRVRLGVSQRELAVRSTVSVRAIRDLEVGRASRPRRDTVGLLARGLALSVRERLELELAAGQVSVRAGPVALDEVIGRDAEVAVLRELLATGRQRSVTLTGLAGVGKSTLAVRAAEELHRAYGLPVLWDPVAAPAELARMVGRQQALVVCDGTDPGDLVEVLRESPGLRVLVTARAPAAVPGRRTVPVTPLPVPRGGEDPAALAAVPAVRLLLAHARRLRPDFVLGAGNAAAVAALCQRLDGLPAALESAACWLLVAEPGDLLAVDPFDLLGEDLPELRRSLLAALGSLDPLESATLAGLCDAGGWTIAEAAARTGIPVLRCARAVRRLLLLGLVRPVGHGARDRFQVLALLRRQLGGS